MANAVWVLVDRTGAEIHTVTFEMLDEGRKIANRLNGHLVAVVFGYRLPDLSATLAGYGADLVYLVDHPLLADYTTDGYACGMVDLIQERSPFLVLLSATVNGRDLAPRVAARLQMGLASDCTSVKLNDAGLVEAICPTHRDKVYRTVALTSPLPYLATFRPGVIGVVRPNPSRQAAVETVSVCIDRSAQRTRVLATTKADPRTLDISEAEIVVAGGRGLASAGNWHLVQNLADALGASVAGSRMATDEGWLPQERLVGQTGKTISPRLYVALGISGAKEHMLGVREARNIVAINLDAAAPIFGVADKAVVGDVKEVVPALVRKLREVRVP